MFLLLLVYIVVFVSVVCLCPSSVPYPGVTKVPVKSSITLFIIPNLCIKLDLNKDKKKINSAVPRNALFYTRYCVFHRTVHLLVMITFVIQFVVHGMNNKKIINAQQAIIIRHYKNTKPPENCNYAESCRNKLIRTVHNIYNGSFVVTDTIHNSIRHARNE